MRLGIEPIGTDAKINTEGWKNAWEGLVQGEAGEVWEYFEQSLSGFHNHRPSITQRFTASVNAAGDVEVIVGILEPTDSNKVYSYVNWGTGPRIIRTTRMPMIFRGSYFPATTRGSLSGGKWAKTGPWTVTFFINHPGIQGRRFDEFIQMAMEGSIQHAARKMLKFQKGKTWRK